MVLLLFLGCVEYYPICPAIGSKFLTTFVVIESSGQERNKNNLNSQVKKDVELL